MDLEKQLNSALESLKAAIPGIEKDFNSLNKFSQTFVDNLENAEEIVIKNSFGRMFRDEKKNLTGVVNTLKKKAKFMKDIDKKYKDGLKDLKLEKKQLDERLKQAEKLKKLGSSATKEQKATLKKLDKENKIKQLAYQEHEQANKMLNKGWLGVQRKVGGVLNFASGIGDIFSEVFKVVGFIGDILGKAFRMVWGLVQKVLDKIFELQRVTGNIAADMGLTADNMRAMSRAIGDAAGNAYLLGASLEEVAQIQTSFTEAIGKNVILSKQQMLNMIEIAKGTALGVDGATELLSTFNLLGKSTESLYDFMSDTNKQLQKSGLNSKKVYENFKGMTPKMVLLSGSFKNMVKDTMEMAKSAAKYRMTLDGITELSDKVFNPEGAIELAAKLKVLGGGFSDMADPFKLMYQGQNDIKGLQDQIIEATAATAIWNEKTKQFEIPPKQRAILKEVAEATGISAENLGNAVMESAKFAKINNAIKQSGVFFGEDKGLKEYIENSSKINEQGQAYIEIWDGTKNTAVELNKLSAQNMDQIAKQLKNTRTLADAAKQRMDLMQRLQAIGDMFFGKIASALLPILQSDKFETLLNKITDSASGIADKLSSFIDQALNPNSGFMKGLGKFFDQVGIIVDRLVSAFNRDGLKGLGMEFVAILKTVVWPTVMELIHASIAMAKEALQPVKDKVNTASKWASAGAGALVGMKAGGIIGSFFGPGPGTAIGGAIGGVIGGAAGYFAAPTMDDGVIQNPKSAQVQTSNGNVNVQKFAKGDALYAINEKAFAGKGGMGSGGGVVNNYNMPGTVTVKIDGGASYNFSREEILRVIAANYQDVANKSTKIAASESNTGQQGKRNSSIPVTPL